MYNTLSSYSISQQFIDQMPGLFIVHDTESRFLMGNQTALRWTGFQSMDSMMGKTYYEMPCKASEQHEAFKKLDQVILNNDGHGRILGLYCYANNNWKFILAEKYPLKNSDGTIAALTSYISDLTYTNIIDISRFLDLVSGTKSPKLLKKQSGYLISESYPVMDLTKKQSECLFFLIRGKTAKDISHLLALSPRTVEQHINDIKLKMNCSTKSQLIEKAISLGYMNIIPPTLLDELS